MFKRKEARAFGAQRARERIKWERRLGQTLQEQDGLGVRLVLSLTTVRSHVLGLNRVFPSPEG